MDKRVVTKQDIDYRVRYNLIRLRQEAGLSQGDLSKWSGVSHISQIENGTITVGKNIVAKLANALDVDVSEFFQPEDGFIEKMDMLSALSRLFREFSPRGQRLILRMVKSFYEYEKGIKFLSSKSI